MWLTAVDLNYLESWSHFICILTQLTIVYQKSDKIRLVKFPVLTPQLDKAWQGKHVYLYSLYMFHGQWQVKVFHIGKKLQSLKPTQREHMNFTQKAQNCLTLVVRQQCCQVTMLPQRLHKQYKFNLRGLRTNPWGMPHIKATLSDSQISC